MSAQLLAALRSYFATAFRWQRGRQGTGYDKMLLLTAGWPLPFDSYLIRYPEGSEIPPHTDPVQTGRHYRLNIILKSPKYGGEFVCAKPLFATKRIKLFRPDVCEHSVTRVVGGSRYVLSVGWVLRRQAMEQSPLERVDFERFAECGSTHAFRLRSGQNFQGWVLEVGEDAVLVMWAPSPFYAQATGTNEMSPPDEWVRFTDIEPASLSYWDDVARRWIDFPKAE